MYSHISFAFLKDTGGEVNIQRGVLGVIKIYKKPMTNTKVLKKEKKAEIKFVMPPMSWEKPIEEEILEYVRHMEQGMERVANRPVDGFLFFKDDSLQKEAQLMAKTYRTVKRHILKEIDFRKLFNLIKS